MNEQAQRVAIATFCGWQAIELRDSIKSGKKDWLSGLNPKPDEIVKVVDAESGGERAPNESDYGYETLPDYLRDLNAMHEAERCLKFGWSGAYASNLGVIIGQSVQPSGWLDAFYLMRATARQRAEALLITIGEWRD